MAKAKSTITITQVKSGIGKVKDQKATLVGLGLGKVNRTSVLEDTPSIRGMVAKVAHLIKIEE